ncbi:hypothetical protein [Actinomycetospora cinnamomea]|uniref:Uncharacterized protein DUF664 n=1 Tax=Actinomycetospora cinnamomea TaxID=663609 RepID=A0A2U1FFC5_9PSEU|nr:uncharacterized protein DUF664 [Actinomycetospora cinnamomea]
MDEAAAKTLHPGIQQGRDAVLWKLEGLGEYDARRPMTPTATGRTWATARAPTRGASSIPGAASP